MIQWQRRRVAASLFMCVLVWAGKARTPSAGGEMKNECTFFSCEFLLCNVSANGGARSIFLARPWRPFFILAWRRRELAPPPLDDVACPCERHAARVVVVVCVCKQTSTRSSLLLLDQSPRRAEVNPPPDDDDDFFLVWPGFCHHTPRPFEAARTRTSRRLMKTASDAVRVV